MKIQIIAVTLLVALAGLSKGQNIPSGKKPVAFDDIQPGGLLESHAQLSFKRLQEEYFQWNSISSVNFKRFPGDAIGRCINGLTLLSQALHQPATPNLLEIIRRYDELANSDGYLGPILPETRANEDVIAAHNGVLCGLTEYIIWNNDAKAKEKLKHVVDNLVVPAKNAIQCYRVDSEEAKIMNWVLSGGDIGQLFLALDGMTRAYTIFPSAELKSTIETAIDRYRKLDLVAISAQTHAMLSATTGILRWYEFQHRPEDLAFAEALYKQYRDLAMTETYENFNWFNRPKWTEACAVIDSYILTVMLWCSTGKVSYLEDAHHILFNGVLAGQLSNGGFGTSPCVCDQTGIHTVKKHLEAPFCCSMRGAEGLTRAMQYSYFTENETVTVPFYTANTATLRLGNGTCKIEETTSYPYEGQVRFEVVESKMSANTDLQFFVPSWAEPGSFEIKVNGKKINTNVRNSFAYLRLQLAKGTVVELTFKQKFGATTALHPDKSPGAVRYFNGPLLLGSATEKAGEPFIPILDLVSKGKKDESRYVYFPVNKATINDGEPVKSGVHDVKKNVPIYQCNLPDEIVTNEVHKLFDELKYDRKKVIFLYLWDAPREVEQVILQWPESAEMPGPENVMLEWNETGNKMSATIPGIIGNGRQWVYSLYKPDKVKAINNLVLNLKTPEISLGKIGVPEVTLINK